MRKNQEREARIEAKRRNERSHIVFAFGSSTPRMLEPADTGGSTFWGTRRATSTTNVMMFPTALPLTRRSSERELDNNKKRATSAGGLDRKPGEGELKRKTVFFNFFPFFLDKPTILDWAEFMGNIPQRRRYTLLFWCVSIFSQYWETILGLCRQSRRSVKFSLYS